MKGWGTGDKNVVSLIAGILQALRKLHEEYTSNKEDNVFISRPSSHHLCQKFLKLEEDGITKCLGDLLIDIILCHHNDCVLLLLW